MSATASLPGHLAILYAGEYTSKKHIYCPPSAALVTAGSAGAAAAVTANFSVTYTGFTPAAQAAFQAAVNVWSVLLATPVTIRIDAHWTPLAPRVLGSAGPASFNRDFTSAPSPGTWYPIALANKIAGRDLATHPTDAHIKANFSSSFPNWYLGSDGRTPSNQYDLMSVVLHEIGHGLGFIGSMHFDAATGQGSWGLRTPFPLAYDRFVKNAQGQSLLDTALFPNPSSALAGQLQSNQLFFNGPNTRNANGGRPAQIYAPIRWEEGSSFSHLNEVSFPSGNANSLMTPQIGMGEAIHSPGPVGLAILHDQGW